MKSELAICLDAARADLAIAACRLESALRRLDKSQEHGPLPQGALDLRQDLDAMLATATRLELVFERLIMAAAAAPGVPS